MTNAEEPGDATRIDCSYREPLLKVSEINLTGVGPELIQYIDFYKSISSKWESLGSQGAVCECVFVRWKIKV